MINNDPELLKRLQWVMGYTPLRTNIHGYIRDAKNLLANRDDEAVDTKEAFETIKTPTLIIHSRADRVSDFDTFVGYAKEILPNSTIEVQPCVHALPKRNIMQCYIEGDSCCRSWRGNHIWSS
eukprot:GHVS01105281.1.p2 GENE.GHVS01105281.1~~GHVS01105281.1.p2  ORF type:complete len:123 (-),score=6.09 GHVS01105281.1:426-794(-)